MKFTISKKNDGLIFFLLFFFIFINISVIIFNNKINIINKFLLKDFKYFIAKKPLYYNYLNNRNYIIYDHQKIILLANLDEKINKFNKVQVANGLTGWIASNKLKSHYNLYLYHKKTHQLMKILQIKEKNHQYIIEGLIFNRFINKKIIIVVNKDQLNNIFF